MKKMKLVDIKIHNSFAESTTSEEKMNECRYNWRCYGKQDRYIVVDNKGYLIDGYIMYKILMEHKEEYAEVKILHCRRKRWYRKNTEDWNIPHYRSKETTYIYGKHYNERKDEYSKEYVWRVPKSWSELGWENGLECGDRIVTSTNNYTIAKIKEIISVEEAIKRTNKNITAEVIGKVDTTAYDKRVEQRKEKEKLKKEMDKRKKELQKKLDDEYYARKDEEYAEMLKKYESM